MPEYICLAGLYHSVYSTSAFSRPLIGLTRRPELFARIGGSAEQLVYLFCIAQRPRALFDAYQSGEICSRFDGKSYRIKPNVLSALLHIECANLLEQESGKDFLRQMLTLGQGGLSDAARKSVEAYIALPATIKKRAKTLSNRAVQIRKALESDIDDLFDLARELHVESHYAWLRFDENIVRKKITSCLKDSKQLSYVALQDNEVCGFLTARREALDFNHAEILRLQYLFVRSPNRWRRVGSLIKIFRGAAEHLDVIDVVISQKKHD
jgi:hypothetical protein